MNLAYRIRAGGLACAAAFLSVAAHAQNFSTLMFFSGTSPSGNMTVGSDGALYGPTTPGSGAFAGLFYRLSPDACSVQTIYQYGLQYDSNLQRIFLGANPSGRMLLSSDGYFYGTTQATTPYGGSGTIFRMAQNGSGYTKLFEFEPLVREGTHQYLVNTTGAFPSSLIEGVENEGGVDVPYFYGVTLQGGRRPVAGDAPIPSGVGTVFKIRRDGTGFTVLHTFDEVYRRDTEDEDDGDATEIATNADGRLTNSDGANPNRRLLLGSDGRLYGVTPVGGPNGTGVIFSLTVDPDDPDFTSVAFDETPPEVDAPPDATHDLEDPNDDFFGFAKRKLNASGAYPATSLVQIGGYIYGTTSALGAIAEAGVPDSDPPKPYSSKGGHGTLFRFPVASFPASVNDIEVIFDFTGSENNRLGPAPAINLPDRPGSSASGELIVIDGNVIVGTVQNGGILTDNESPTDDVGGAGAIFRYNVDTLAYETPLVFGVSANHSGAYPSEGVIAVPEGGSYAFYGVTSSGGFWGQGTAYKFGPTVAACSTTPLGTPEPYDDGGGSIGKWLVGALALLAALQLIAFRHRRMRLQRVRSRDRIG